MSGTTELAVTSNVESILSDARSLIQPTQRAALDTLPTEIRHVAGFHLGWWDTTGRAAAGGGGKSIRPALTLACARAAGGAAAAAVTAAVAVELVHDFSLMHDDIMDGDATRRHRPTAWAAFGVPRALLTGDALLALALNLVSAGIPGAALRTLILELCAGQSDDLTFESRVDVALPESSRMVEQKTGALFGVACQLGALSAGVEAHIADLYRQFGRHLGIAFQMIDDILGIWGSESVTGKPIYSDLRSRKKSVPVVAAMSANTAAARELAELYRRSAALDDSELAHAAELIEAAGGRVWAETEADRHRVAALDALAAAAPTQDGLAQLHALTELVTSRVS
ncbi:dimethylallyltranstransferase [Mycobacterium asiaticum]|uniref:Dimethylallyltranstransferase n=1 Tax=Mycobacterium asiaticum TaxID=1790 RepID=A0A1A3P6T0_MYCAS|nr:polyprenyl synthetase family protein [Mycobacterium asiaticum]OBK29370.1 dimethylallyltranstransferase [Mycobacterium asiaticum]